MNAVEIFKRIAVRFPKANPKLTVLPSGAAMLDITIGDVLYCAEYFPAHNAYGLSMTSGATPFWEGVDQTFASAEELEAKVLEMMNSAK